MQFQYKYSNVIVDMLTAREGHRALELPQSKVKVIFYFPSIMEKVQLCTIIKTY